MFSLRLGLVPPAGCLRARIVYGSAQLQTFYGPFLTESARDEYLEYIRSKEDLCFSSAKNHFDQDVRESAETINPNHTKHLKHNGPLAGDSWNKIPTETDGVFCWIKSDDEQNFVVKLLEG